MSSSNNKYVAATMAFRLRKLGRERIRALPLNIRSNFLFELVRIQFSSSTKSFRRFSRGNTAEVEDGIFFFPDFFILWANGLAEITAKKTAIRKHGLKIFEFDGRIDNLYRKFKPLFFRPE